VGKRDQEVQDGKKAKRTPRAQVRCQGEKTTASTADRKRGGKGGTFYLDAEGEPSSRRPINAGRAVSGVRRICQDGVMGGGARGGGLDGPEEDTSKISHFKGAQQITSKKSRKKKGVPVSG